MKKPHPARTPRLPKWPAGKPLSWRDAARLGEEVMTHDVSALMAHARATKERARPLLEATVCAMTDEAVIDAMDRLVLLACSREHAEHAPYAGLAWNMWIGVREYVAAYARGESGVQRGVRGKSTKKARR